MRIVFALAAMAVLMACAEDQPWHWAKPGASPQDFQAAAYECERDTRMASRSFGYGVVAEMQAGAFVERCMNAKGFYRQAGVAGANASPSLGGPRYRAWADKRADCARASNQFSVINACSGPAPPRDS